MLWSMFVAALLKCQHRLCDENNKWSAQSEAQIHTVNLIGMFWFEHNLCSNNMLTERKLMTFWLLVWSLDFDVCHANNNTHLTMSGQEGSPFMHHPVCKGAMWDKNDGENETQRVVFQNQVVFICCEVTRTTFFLTSNWPVWVQRAAFDWLAHGNNPDWPTSWRLESLTCGTIGRVQTI